MNILLFIIALIAMGLGSLAGLGGGIIIKPVLDLLHFDALLVSGLSSLTVLSIAITSSAKHIYRKRFDERSAFLVLGALLGGLLGNLVLFAYEVDTLQSTQSLMLAITLGFILVLMPFRKKWKSFSIEDRAVFVIMGLLLGMLSSFLGIGGGPINFFVLYVLFKLENKELAAASVFIVAAAQVSKLFFVSRFDFSYLLFMIPGGIIGGYMGAYFTNKINLKTRAIIFYLSIFAMIVVNLYNYGLFDMLMK